MRKPICILEKYGKQSYVFITGASDGIGKGLAIELARLNFNLILVARNKQKLEDVKKEILQINKVKIEIIECDFKNSNNVKFYDDIMEKVKGFDVSILINNVGVAENNNFTEIPQQNLIDMITVNCYPIVLLSHAFLPKLLQRKNKSAIINLSSVASLKQMPYVQLYGATKIFDDYFSNALSLEYPQIDILSLQPGYVISNMSGLKKESLTCISAKDCALACLQYLGSSTATQGHWKHQLTSLAMNMIPKQIMKIILEQKLLKKKMKQQ